jgi:hypothetical protein
MRKIFVITFLLLFVSLAHATIWYVHPDSAIAFVQEGLDSCSAGDTVVVGPGTYYENIFWPNTQSIRLYSHHGADTTILDGAGMDRIMTIDVNIDTTTHIHGFTFQYGYGDVGGAVYCEGASPCISRCNFTMNEAHGTTGGGAIACVNQSDPLIVHCNIFDNTCTTYPGGGILVYDYSSPIIHASNITTNTGSSGAGISVAYGCFPLIDSCTIADNYEDGIYFGGGDGQVYYCNITNNAGYGIRNGDPNFDIEAQLNWWGHSSGPGGVGPGSGDEVSNYVSYNPWLTSPVTSIRERVERKVDNWQYGATIVKGPIQLPSGKNCVIYDISGREINPMHAGPGIFFIEVDGKDVYKIIKVE